MIERRGHNKSGLFDLSTAQQQIASCDENIPLEEFTTNCMVKLVGSPEVLDRGEGVSAYDDLRGDVRHAGGPSAHFTQYTTTCNVTAKRAASSNTDVQ